MSDSVPTSPDTNQPYRVLARKYRPQTFADLIGQDAMVQTLGNAIKHDRLAHAFLMTGVRGVGKTSTARLIAKALNCIGPDGEGGPTIDPCGVCEPCQAIAEGRHIDVIEMDAASHTGVDDVREIIEAVRYAAVSARYKIYIIDEVHMLTKNAFNALLKTLEEPPAHVKFLFATTEVNKVPITVLSRCQRFDLRRITPDMLSGLFTGILEKEGVAAEEEAVWLIANAAEGSARDGLSILDQAIAHADLDGGDKIKASQVREMLGLSDRGAIRRLFGLLIAGDAGAMLNAIREQYGLGVEPVALMRGLMDLVHAVTVVKVGRADNPVFGAEERANLSEWAHGLSFPALHRLWQLLLKGHDEVVKAAQPIETAEMALLRVLHAASMPDPGALATLMQNGGGGQLQAAGQGAAAVAAQQVYEPVAATASTPAQKPLPATVKELVELCWNHNLAGIGQVLQDHVRPIRFEPPMLEMARVPGMPSGFDRDLSEALYSLTQTRWQISFGDGEGEASLFEQERAQKAAEQDEIMALPVVKAAFETFPGARLVAADPKDRRTYN